MAHTSETKILCDVCGNVRRSTQTWELILHGETRYVTLCREHEKEPLTTLWKRYSIPSVRGGRRGKVWTMEEIEALKTQKDPRP